MMAELFDIESNTITYHLKAIFDCGELEQGATARKFRVVQKEGNRQVTREVDYDKTSLFTKQFFAKVQNKLHFAVSKHTAAEIIFVRADSGKNHMGLSSWKNSPEGKILKSDVSIAKNYLSKEELDDLGRIVNAFLELAESRAKRKIPMTMEDWGNRIDKFLLADDRDILKEAGKISMAIAKDHAESEFEKYRIVQDRLFQSDFDRMIDESEK